MSEIETPKVLNIMSAVLVLSLEPLSLGVCFERLSIGSFSELSRRPICL